MSKSISQKEYDETGFLDVPIVKDAYYFRVLELTNRARRMRDKDFERFEKVMHQMNRDNIEKWSGRIDEILDGIHSEYEKESNYETNIYKNGHPDIETGSSRTQ